MLEPDPKPSDETGPAGPAGEGGESEDIRTTMRLRRPPPAPPAEAPNGVAVEAPRPPLSRHPALDPPKPTVPEEHEPQEEQAARAALEGARKAAREAANALEEAAAGRRSRRKEAQPRRTRKRASAGGRTAVKAGAAARAAPAPAAEPPPVPAPAVEAEAQLQPPPPAVEAEAEPQPPRPARPDRLPAALPLEVPRTLLGQPVGLRLDGVSRVFKAGEVSVHALQNVSFEVAPGEFVAVTGPSGCGKTTLLSLLGGLDKPTSGHVYAAGTPLDQLSEADLADYRLQRVGTVFQTFNLVPSLNAEDNVALPLALAGRRSKERHKRTEMLLGVLGLKDRARFKPGRLSGGEQQRVAIARALANRPGLILADEPTGNLDSRQGEKVLGLLEDLHRQGATVVLVTHDAAIAARADRAVRLQDGRLAHSPRSRRKTARAPEALDPPSRLSRPDAVAMGLMGVARRPLRSTLTAGGVALGIVVMALILALAVGVQSEAETAATNVHLRQVMVQTDRTQKQPRSLDQASLGTLRQVPHVHDAWGQVALQGSMSLKGAQPGDQPPPPAVLASLPPRTQWGQDPAGSLVSGRLPAKDTSAEVVISVQQARRLGLQPFNALGQKVDFSAAWSALQQPGTSPEKAEQPVPQTLTIVGVTPDEPMSGALPGGLVPYGTATTYWSKLAEANSWKGAEFASVTLRADDAVNVPFVRDQARILGFAAQSQDDRLRSEQEHLLYLELALAGLAVIAVVVAFIGIVNTMYAAVLERTTEIGVLKALGARRGDVRLLFTAEAALIGAMAGMVGVVGAGLVARFGNQAIDRVAAGRGVHLSLDLFQMRAWIWALAIVLGVVLSALSGLLPASRAAGLEPVQALRKE